MCIHLWKFFVFALFVSKNLVFCSNFRKFMFYFH